MHDVLLSSQRGSIKVCLCVLMLLGLGEPALAGDNQQLDPSIALGERLYREGVASSGEPLRATMQGDITFSGEQFSCVNCHRRSGYGSSEGGNYVLPITGPSLYRPRELDRADLFKKLFKETQPRVFQSRMRSPRMRPAYTDQTLARVIRDGIDPSGRALDRLMPRYQLNDEDMANLIAYLKSLAAQSDPGVDDQYIYFSTIVTDNVDLDKRRAVLATLRKFVEWINLDVAGDLRNPNFSPNYRSDFIKAYRLWRLDVWELEDDPQSWGQQLERLYAKRPVFAVISGLVEGPWKPIQAFCERQRLPCLFPHTELPVTTDAFVYSVHFTRGLTLEAEVIAHYLLVDDSVPPDAKVLQLHYAGASGSVPASVLGERFTDVPGFTLAQRNFSDSEGLRRELERIAEDDAPLDILVVWPGNQSLAFLEWLNRNPTVAQRVFLPSSALEALPEFLSDELEERLYLSYPYELPGAYHPRAFRVRSWMRSRHLDITQPRLQFDTYYALTMVQFGLEHIVDNFSRDYLLEYVEHEAENALNPGTYPRLSLGPGQRFASKGGYIVKLVLGSPHRIAAASEWIVP